MLTFGFNILAEHLFCAKNNQRLTFVFYTLVETNDISEPILWQFVCSQESRYANIFLLVRLVSVCHRPVFLWKQKWRQKSDWMEVLCLVYTFVFSPEPNRNSLTQDIFGNWKVSEKQMGRTNHFQLTSFPVSGDVGPVSFFVQFLPLSIS